MISKKYKLINISFWTEPALILTLYYHMDLLKKNGHYDPLVKRGDVVDYVPGVKSIKPTDMMSYLQTTNTNTVTHRIIHKGIFQEGKKADFVVCNTIQELEPHTISAFDNIQPFYAIGPIFPNEFTQELVSTSLWTELDCTGWLDKKPPKSPFYAIGPIFPNEFTQELVSTSLWTELDCTGWLDKKPPKSVLYLSFGSYAHISKYELGEIACGLLQSGVSFVWALRPDVVSSNDTNPLPLGFEDDIKDQGL
nr:UDP-glycosyltransferase 86A1-like [Tanacetum cinerariifolium]